MTARDDFFARNRLNINRLADRTVAFVGLGSVGSEMALHLGRGCGVGHLFFIDGGTLQTHNLMRHALPPEYVGANKADAMADFLSSVPGIDVAAIDHNLDDSFTDAEIDTLLAPADLTIIATDDRHTQRRISTRLNALDSLSVSPGLYRDGGGEVVVGLGPRFPCPRCWDEFRHEDLAVRGVDAICADAMAVIQHAIFVCIGLLDTSSAEARELAPTREDPRPRQLFVIEPSRRIVRLGLRRRPGCPSCNVGPSSIDGDAVRATVNGSGGLHDLAAPRHSGVARDWAFSHWTPRRPPLIQRFTLSAAVVLEGASVTVGWAADDATFVTIDDGEPLPTTGTTEITVSAHHAFTLRAHNPYGTATSVSAPVRVIPLPRLVAPELPPLSIARPGSITEPPSGVFPRSPAEWPAFTPPSFGFPRPPDSSPHRRRGNYLTRLRREKGKTSR